MTNLMTPEEIDNFIKAEVNRLGPNTKGHPRRKDGASWRPEALLLRRQAIMRMLGEGKTKWTIISEVMRRWGVAEKTAKTYVNDCYKFVADSYREDTESLREILVHRLESMVEDAISSRDRKSALKAYEMLAKISGVLDDKIRLEGETTIKFDFGNAE